MKLDQLAAALVVASLSAASPGFGGAWGADPWARTFAPACTPEAQKCLEKLEARLYLHGRAQDATGIERALLELEETDPECALLLRGAALHGL